MTVDEWIEEYRRAWETRDPARAAALFTDDARYRSHIHEDPHTGPDGVRTYWSEVTATQSEVSVRMGRPFLDGRRVAVEFWTTMTVGADPVTLSGCLLLEFGADGRCRRLREYWHFGPGTLSPPEEWGT